MINIIGRTFGSLTVLQREANEPKKQSAMWLCYCNLCKKNHVYAGAHLANGTRRFCDCQRSTALSEAKRKHGCSQWIKGKNNSLYATWLNMRKRCNSPNNPAYKYYGGCGIKVCKEWDDFACFAADMGPRPSLKHSIDRINNLDGYRPGNVRWATMKEQCNNRRQYGSIVSTRDKITYCGVTQSGADWDRELKLNIGTIRSRVYRSGWSLEKAMTTPMLDKQSVCTLARASRTWTAARGRIKS